MKRRNSLLIVLLFLSSGLFAQVTRVCFNEILVTNHENFEDDYGQKVPWFELFNGSYNVVNIGGCYLTDDISNPKKYMIPKGDVKTSIQTRQHVIFYADNKPTRGTFHLNFSLDSSKVNTIYLFNADGKGLIDSVVVPVLPADVSWGRPVDGEPQWEMLTKVTPSTNNLTLDSNVKIERFAESDPVGVIMSITAMGVVFLVLLISCYAFKGVAASFRLANKKKQPTTQKQQSAVSTEDVSGEVMAAISMALYEMTNDAHDVENTVLTIARTRRTYSPWSSKIYGLRQSPK
jgi:Na+-transporting methylmalonyl-CoA/oxaloacetate decarboxylase gamma subunit